MTQLTRSVTLRRFARSFVLQLEAAEERTSCERCHCTGARFSERSVQRMGMQEVSYRAAELAALRAELVCLAVTLTRNHDDAEDLVQSAFARLAQAHEAPAREGLKPLLCTIVKRLAIDRARHQRRWRMAPLELELADEQPDEESPTWTVVSTEQVREALELASPVDREAFRLYYVKGMRYRDIAGLLDIALGTVATRLHRVRVQLRQALTPRPGNARLP